MTQRWRVLTPQAEHAGRGVALAAQVLALEVTAQTSETEPPPKTGEAGVSGAALPAGLARSW